MQRMQAGLLNSFPKTSSLGPKGNLGALSQPCLRPAAQRGDPGGAGCSAHPGAAVESRRSPARALGIDRALTHPVPSHPHGDLETTSANLEEQLFPGIQTAERKGAGLGKRKSKKGPGRKAAGRAPGQEQGGGPPRR